MTELKSNRIVTMTYSSIVNLSQLPQRQQQPQDKKCKQKPQASQKFLQIRPRISHPRQRYSGLLVLSLIQCFVHQSLMLLQVVNIFEVQGLRRRSNYMSAWAAFNSRAKKSPQISDQNQHCYRTARHLWHGFSLQKMDLKTTGTTTQLHSGLEIASSVLFANAIAGSIAGAVGVGVAYPLDTIKTKQQLRTINHNMMTNQFTSSMSYDDQNPTSIMSLVKDIYKDEGISGFYSGVKTTMMGQAIMKSVAFTTNAMALQFLQQQLSNEGTNTPLSLLVASACFSGFITAFLVVPIERVKVIMQSQSHDTKHDKLLQQMQQQQGLDIVLPPIEGVADDITCYDVTLNGIGRGLASNCRIGTPTVVASVSPPLEAATFFKGSTTSTTLQAMTDYNTEVVGAPIMAKSSTRYRNELECVKAVLECDGLYGWLFRGLSPTLLREVPRYGLYFVLYSVLQDSILDFTATTTTESSIAFSGLQPLIPLFCGAIAGCLSWLPVYPTDVIKTVIQNTEGDNERDMTIVHNKDSTAKKTVYKNSPIQVFMDLYQAGDNSFKVFYDGLTPKLLRAAVINSVTFYTYDIVLEILTKSTPLQ